MKLTQQQVQTATETLGLKVIGDDHDVRPQLEQALGAHTFFINDRGLFVFQPHDESVEPPKIARLFVVATWSEETEGQLKPLQRPTEADVYFDLVEGVITGGGQETS